MASQSKKKHNPDIEAFRLDIKQCVYRWGFLPRLKNKDLAAELGLKEAYLSRLLRGRGAFCPSRAKVLQIYRGLEEIERERCEATEYYKRYFVFRGELDEAIDRWLAYLEYLPL